MTLMDMRVSSGAISESKTSLCVPVTVLILRNSGAKKYLLQMGVVELRRSILTGKFVIVQGVVGGYETMPVLLKIGLGVWLCECS